MSGAIDRRPVRLRIAENVLIRRLLRNWSQEELAAAAELDRSFVGGIERGERNISVETLEKLAQAFGIDLDELTADVDPAAVGERILARVRGALGGGGMFKVRETPACYAAFAPC